MIKNVNKSYPYQKQKKKQTADGQTYMRLGIYAIQDENKERRGVLYS